METVKILSNDTGVQVACDTFNIPRANYYRHRNPINKPIKRRNFTPPLALSDEERQTVLGELHSERFLDKSPQEIYTTLLDEDTYHCSPRTMYRILAKEGEVRERRNQVRHPSYKKPELLATSPNQVWSWDITKLKGPAKWKYYYLYVIMDIFSRYVVGWLVAHQEQSALAKRLISETCRKQEIKPNQLTIHADRGSSMKSKPVAFLLSDLGVTKSHSRPYVSNDNPYSESQFKTLKYRPDFPGNFGCIEDSRSFCQDFFNWYNFEHYHSGIANLTPESLHYGRGSQIIEDRAKVLKLAFEANTARFKGKIPKHIDVPESVWINRPKNILTNLEKTK